MIKIKSLLGGCLSSILLLSSAHADVVKSENLIINGATCIGNDCLDGEAFSTATLRLKENNTRLRFIDTSANGLGASWNVEANASENGGARYFAIQLKSSDTVVPALELNHTGNRVVIGQQSTAVDDAVSIGSETLLRRLTHVARGIAQSDALIKNTLDTYSPFIQQHTQIIEIHQQLTTWQSELEAINATLESLEENQSQTLLGSSATHPISVLTLLGLALLSIKRRQLR